MPLPDFYEVLQVRPDADQATIRAAYRRLAKLYHPDFNQDPDAALRMQEVNAAYEVLGDRVKRRSYDAARAVQLVLAGEAAARWDPAPPSQRERPRGAYEPPELTEAERRRLAARSEIRRRWPRRDAPAVARCYRCGFLWSLRGEAAPPRCPYCRRRDWDRYRVFQCIRCGHVWDSSTLRGAATAVYPACVRCGTLDWHAPTVRRRRRAAAVRRLLRAALRPPAAAVRLLILLLRPFRLLLRLAARALLAAARGLRHLARAVASRLRRAARRGAWLLARRGPRVLHWPRRGGP